MLLDSHAHLDMSQFDRDREEVIQRAFDAGVQWILTIATATPDRASLQASVELVESYPSLYAGMGVHPHDAKCADDELFRTLGAWVQHPKVVLWGEIGLDFYYDLSPREVQKQVFRTQLRLARLAGLPVSIHCRDAWPELIEILREEQLAGALRGILHSFTGSPEQALECVSLGFMISFSGIVTFKNAMDLREAARIIPLSSILVETDCPYLAPAPHRGERNEPAFVADIARCLAKIRGVPLEDLSQQILQNFQNITGVSLERA
jgi:TatD DNase family protein